MTYPESRLPEVCAWTQEQADDCLKRARAGDLEALADWTIFAVHKRLRTMLASPAAAIYQLRNLISFVDLKPKVGL